jgi:hypothetical protein
MTPLAPARRYGPVHVDPISQIALPITGYAIRFHRTLDPEEAGRRSGA